MDQMMELREKTKDKWRQRNETDRQTYRQTETNRQRQTSRDKHTETDKQTQTDRDRQAETMILGQNGIRPKWY